MQDIATAFQQGINKHDAAMLANLFTPDAVFVIGAGQTLKGPDQIKDFYVKYFDGPAKSLHDFKPTVGELRLIGNGAWAIGTSQIMSADGKEMLSLSLTPLTSRLRWRCRYRFRWRDFRYR